AASAWRLAGVGDGGRAGRGLHLGRWRAASGHRPQEPCRGVAGVGAHAAHQYTARWRLRDRRGEVAVPPHGCGGYCAGPASSRRTTPRRVRDTANLAQGLLVVPRALLYSSAEGLVEGQHQQTPTPSGKRDTIAKRPTKYLTAKPARRRRGSRPRSGVKSSTR